MAYASWSVVFGEQPSAAKWNILGTNDSSFNDGTGIGTNAIAAASLATNCITLGYASRTTNFTSTSTSSVQLTSVSAAVTIPSGSRKIKVTGFVGVTGQTVNDGEVYLELWDGTVGSGTQISTSYNAKRTAGTQDMGGLVSIAVVTPAAGAKTYNAGVKVGSAGGTGTWGAAATYPAFILVEVI